MSDNYHDITGLLGAAGQRPQQFTAASEPAGLDENLFLIQAELDAPAESRLARILRRLGVSDLTIPLVTATPALRRSWFGAMAIAVLFGLVAATGEEATGVDRIVVFLTLAPLLPLLGVAMAFGKGVDPTHDLVVAAPRDTFTVFLIRSITVLLASSLVLLASSLLLPAGGAFRFAWLMPSLAIAAVTFALAPRFGTRRAAAGVGIAWLVVVLAVTNASSSASMFGPITQVAALVIAAIAVLGLARSRVSFDLGGSA